MPSTAIDFFSYAEDSRELTVGFVGGETYVYQDVPPMIAEGLGASRSKGAFVNRHIRDRFAFRRGATLAPDLAAPRLPLRDALARSQAVAAPVPVERLNFFIVSGGPGSGKTSIIDKLASRGFTTVAETGRAILREQAGTGGTAVHGGDSAAYGEEMLARGIADFRRMASTADEPVFFDRGLAELAGYFRLMGLPVPEKVTAAARDLRSNPRVFLMPPWQAIYRQDSERRQDWAEAVRTFELVRDAYVEAGYRPAEVPRDTVARRVAFILAAVDAAEAGG